MPGARRGRSRRRSASRDRDWLVGVDIGGNSEERLMESKRH